MGVGGEKERVSAEVIRSDPASPTAPVLPTVNPAVEKREAPASKLHPAFYVMYVRTYHRYITKISGLPCFYSAWIALSSSVILFNKEILADDRLGFRMSMLCS